MASGTGRAAGFVGVKMVSGEVVYSHSTLGIHLARLASAAKSAAAAAPPGGPPPMMPLPPDRSRAGRERADLSTLAALVARRRSASSLTAAAAAGAAAATAATVSAAAAAAQGAQTASDGIGDAGASTVGRHSELTSMLQPLRIEPDEAASALW